MAERLSVEIVERALAGDAAALRRLVDAHQDDMLNLAFRITGDAARSWEIVSEVFLRLLEHPGSVAGRESIIEEPLLHGVWSLARGERPRTDELPRGDRAVEAVSAAAMALPERSRCALALADLLKLPAATVAAVLGVTAAAAADQLTRARLALAEGVGVRGRDAALVEAEAARVYGLWPAETGDPMAPEVVAEAERRGLLGALGVGSGAMMIGGVRITPAIGVAILLVPLLVAVAIAMAVRSGGGDSPTPTGTLDAVTDTFTGTDGLTGPFTDGRTGATTNVISTVSPGDSVDNPDGSAGSQGSDGGSAGSDSGSATPTQATPTPATTTQAPATTTATPTVTRAPGSGAPPAPTTTQAPAPTTTASAPRPAPTSSGPGQVPLP